MGTVYRATQLSLERVVALKLLTAELSADPAFRERFRREGLLQAALDHPHIVTVYEAGETDNRLFLAMRMVEGPTLKDLILRRQLDDRRALRLLTQVAEALDAAHAKGLIHRDVKPQNVLVGAGDHAYLADFGLTKGNDDDAMTETGQFVGTIDYISPEQARGGRATGRSDVYALTAVLCECLTGQVPFERSTEERALLAHLTEPPPRLSEMRADIPAAMDEVIARGMAKDPEERPASAGELMLQARRALGAAPAESTAPASTDATRLRPAVGGPTRAPHTAAEGRPGRDPSRRCRRDGARRRAHTRRAWCTGRRACGVPNPARSRPAGHRHTHGAHMPQRRSQPEIPAGARPRRRARTRRRAAAGRKLGQLRHRLQRLGVGGLRRTLLPLQLAAARKPPHGAGTHLLTAARAEHRVSRTAPPAPTRPPPASASLQARWLPPSHRCCQPRSPPPSTGRCPIPTPVKLGAYEAYRYSGLSVHGLASPLTLYTVPTTGGVVTIACLGSAAAASGSQCAQIAATLKLNGTTAFGLAPSQQYASALGSTFGTLNSAVNTGTDPPARGVERIRAGHRGRAAGRRLRHRLTRAREALRQSRGAEHQRQPRRLAGGTQPRLRRAGRPPRAPETKQPTHGPSARSAATAPARRARSRPCARLATRSPADRQPEARATRARAGRHPAARATDSG